MPYSARLFDSVPPEVNTTSAGLKPPPTQRAMSRRHCSSLAYAMRPSVWREFGFAPAISDSSYARSASMASSHMGAEAA